MFSKHKPHASRRKGLKMAFFVAGDLDQLILTFKLVRASDQASLPCKFDPRYFIHKQKTTHLRRQKQNLPQFTACAVRQLLGFSGRSSILKGGSSGYLEVRKSLGKVPIMGLGAKFPRSW